MMQETQHDKLHAALTDLGPDLPEPRAPHRVRRMIESMPAHAPAVRAPWLRAGLWLTAAAACVLAVLSLVLFVQNERLRRQLIAIRSDASMLQPASQAIPPLMMVNFVHDECPVARSMAPRIHEIASRYSDQPVLFVTLDVTETCASQSRLLAQSLGVEQVLSESHVPEQSGTVALIDTRTHEVVASCSGVEKLGAFEQVLDSKVASCAGACPPR